MPAESSGSGAEELGPTAANQTGPDAAAMTGGAPDLSRCTAIPFGADLAPALRRACRERLGEIHWFRTDWQRGGALTGYTSVVDEDGRPVEAVLKLPVPPVERQWLQRLGRARDVAPRLLAHGESLNGYDLAWVVMERLPYGPLSAAWGGRAFDLLIEAAGRFYAAASDVPLTGGRREKDWQNLYTRARRNVQRNDLPNGPAWTKALKKAHRKLGDWLDVWNARPIDDWCHGDFHLANALTRQPAPDGPAVLIDFAQAHRGHWVEDLLYLEHLYWSRRDRLEGRRLGRLMSQERKRHGLCGEGDWSQLAAAGRALLAMSAPAALRQEGERAHLQAALEVLEAAVG